MGRLHCKRCSKEVHPGRGDYYLVRIEAVADPQPPVITQEDLDQGVIRCRFVFSGVIRFRFISSGKNDELTPDFPPADTGFPPRWVLEEDRRAGSAWGRRMRAWARAELAPRLPR